jgi:hypothetical protein
MPWIRRNTGLGSWAALFALTVQLYLSFGHVHLEDFHVSSTAVAASSPSQPDTPVDDDHSRDGHDFCAICAALSLTASSNLPTIALLATPISHPHKWAVDLRLVQISDTVRLPFQARAPPRSI